MAAKPQKSEIYRVKSLRFSSGERFVGIVDQRGLLVYLANVYAMTSLRESGCASSTMDAHMRVVSALMNWSDGKGINLEARTATLEMLSVEEIVDLRDALRARKREFPVKDSRVQTKTVTGATLYNRCHMARDYIAWLGRRAVHAIRPGDPKHLDARYALERFEQAMVVGLPKPRSPCREGPDEGQQRLFLEVIRPDHPSNPFKKEHRHRNHALLAHQRATDYPCRLRGRGGCLRKRRGPASRLGHSNRG